MTQQDYKVASIELAEFGRKEIRLAESEMPALMALRRKYRPTTAERRKILGCIHMTIQTAVLIETLVALGAEVRWSSCNIFSTQDQAAAAIAAAGIPVFAWKGETEEEYEWCLEQTILKDGKPWDANMILDDGGDLTELLHEKYPAMLDKVHGVTEETTTGVHRLLDMLDKGELKVPAINVNDSVTKSKNDNKYGCRHSLNDAIKRGTDHLLSGKQALVIGYGDVGKGSAQTLRQEGMIVKSLRNRSDLRHAGLHGRLRSGFAVHRRYQQRHEAKHRQALLGKIDLIVTAPATSTFATRTCSKALKKRRRGLQHRPLRQRDRHRFHARELGMGRGEATGAQDRTASDDASDDYLILLSEGRLVNLGNATGHPSRIMDGSFANQVLAQIYLYERSRWADLPPESARAVTVEVLPKKLDEEVAQLNGPRFRRRA